MVDLPAGMRFTPFRFEMHQEPTGYLPNDPAAHACWYFYVLCQGNKEKVGDSIDDQFGMIEGNLWMNKNYENIANTVCKIYGLKSPDDFFPYWPAVIMEANRCNLPAPAAEYMRKVRFVDLNT